MKRWNDLDEAERSIARVKCEHLALEQIMGETPMHSHLADRWSAYIHRRYPSGFLRLPVPPGLREEFAHVFRTEIALRADHLALTAWFKDAEDLVIRLYEGGAGDVLQ